MKLKENDFVSCLLDSEKPSYFVGIAPINKVDSTGLYKVNSNWYSRSELELVVPGGETIAKLEVKSIHTDPSINNGGKTSVYQLPEWVKDCDDFSEWRELNPFQFNILKAAWAFNTQRHKGTDEVRDLNKIVHYAKRQLSLLNKKEGKK